MFNNLYCYMFIFFIILNIVPLICIKAIRNLLYHETKYFYKCINTGC